MKETDSDDKPKTKDRRLGDEWLGWNGDPDAGDAEVNEKLSTFFLLGAGAVFILIAGIGIGWYLSKPRIEQLLPSLFPRIIEWVILLFGILFFFTALVESILLLKLRKSLFPYIWSEKFMVGLFARSVWLGERLGISKDRVANSFIKMHNIMVRSHAKRLKADTFLILLPRCLEKETRKQVIERANGSSIQVVTAGGGEEARRAVSQYKPSLILAIACERDLISGIRDVAKKIPVLAIPNKRPEGPCKNTHVQLEDLDEALRFLIESRDGK
jgi:uncharacterized protein